MIRTIVNAFIVLIYARQRFKCFINIHLILQCWYNYHYFAIKDPQAL